ncbi:MAG: hypothetical protein Rhims3KO_36490 [Hyphomicrobiales bacterium]
MPSKNETLRQTLGEDYLKHRVFSDIERYAEFYEALSMSTFSFSTVGTTALCNIDTYVFSSLQNTLDSISDVLAKGRVNDAYYLLRKYYDASVINIYTNVYLKNECTLENFLVAKINNWLRGQENLPSYREMMNYLKSDANLDPMNKLLFQKGSKRYSDLRQRCNDHAHYNFYQSLLLNDGHVRVNTRRKWLDALAVDLKDILVLHLSYLFYVNDHYMGSSDYVDTIEMGITPDEGSQYWVAPFVQKVFTEVLQAERPDIARLLQDNTCMQLK